MGPKGLLAFAGLHQNGTGPNADGRDQITVRVSNHRHVGELPAHTVGNVVQQTWRRLATQAAVFGTVRTEEDRLDGATHFLEQVLEFAVHGMQGVQIKEAPSKPGLIGGHKDSPALVAQSAHGF